MDTDLLYPVILLLIFIYPVLWAMLLTYWLGYPPPSAVHGPMIIVGLQAVIAIAVAPVSGFHDAEIIAALCALLLWNMHLARNCWIDFIANLRIKRPPTVKQLLGGPVWSMGAIGILCMIIF